MKNREIAIGVIIIGVFMVAFSYYMVINKVSEKPKTRPTTEVTLSEFQVAACNAADRGGTCKTRLPKLNLVSAAECCEYLSKCC